MRELISRARTASEMAFSNGRCTIGVTDAQLKNAQIEIARAAVRHFALSTDLLAFDTTTRNHSQIER